MLHKLAVVLLLVGLALSASAVTDPAQGKPTEEITAMQLEQRLVTIQGKPDADAALMLSRLELTERLSTARLARFNAALPGDKSRQALMLVADSAAFLDLPEADVPPDPVPDSAALRGMMVQVVSYVNTTLRQLPNLIAVRETSRFEDRPQEDVLGSTGITTVFYQPLHYVGRGSVQITYRDHREVQTTASGSQSRSNLRCAAWSLPGSSGRSSARWWQTPSTAKLPGATGNRAQA